MGAGPGRQRDLTAGDRGQGLLLASVNRGHLGECMAYNQACI